VGSVVLGEDQGGIGTDAEIEREREAVARLGDRLAVQAQLVAERLVVA